MEVDVKLFVEPNLDDGDQNNKHAQKQVERISTEKQRPVGSQKQHRKMMSSAQKLNKLKQSLLIRRRKKGNEKFRLTLEKRVITTALSSTQQRPQNTGESSGGQHTNDNHQVPPMSIDLSTVENMMRKNRVYLRCPACSGHFRKDFFKFHLFKRHGIGQLRMVPCPECGSEFMSKGDMRKHLRFVHFKIRPPRRKVNLTMNAKRRGVGTNKQEAETEEEDVEVMCEECGKVLPNRREAVKHRRNVHLYNQPAECSDCGQRFVNKRSLWRHMSNVHVEKGQPKDTSGQLPRGRTPVKCEQSTEAQDEDDGEHEDHLCTECGQKFPHQGGLGLSNLKRHYFYLHGEGANPDNFLQCPEEGCGKKFKQKATLDDHIRRAHKGVDFRCDICGRDLQGAGKLWKHKVEVHGMTELEPPPEVDVIQCEYCDERVLRGYATHLKKKHAEVDVDLSKLTKKKKKSTGSSGAKRNTGNTTAKESAREEVKCPECSKQIFKSSLKRHLRHVHGKGEKRAFPCPECGKEFRERYHMTDHVKAVHKKIDKVIKAKKLVLRSRNAKARKGFMYSCGVCHEELSGGSDAEIRVHIFKAHPELYASLEQNEENAAILINCHLCSWKEDKTDEESPNLRRHLQVDHPDECWKCPECDKVIISPNELEDHFELEHNEENRDIKFLQKFVDPSSAALDLLCSRCDNTGSDSLAELGEHVKVSHPECYWPCPLCERFEYSERGLHFHIFFLCLQRKTEEGRWKRREIETSQEGRKGFEQVEVKCCICASKMKLYSLRSHFLRVHGVTEDVWECERCAKRFNNREYWMSHMDHHHAMPFDILLEMALKMNVKDESQVKIKNNTRIAKGHLNLSSKAPTRRLKKTQIKSEEAELGTTGMVRKHGHGKRRKPRKRSIDANAVAKNLGVKLKTLEVRIVRLSQSEINSYLHKEDNIVVKIEV